MLERVSCRCAALLLASGMGTVLGEVDWVTQMQQGSKRTLLARGLGGSRNF